MKHGLDTFYADIQLSLLTAIFLGWYCVFIGTAQYLKSVANAKSLWFSDAAFHASAPPNLSSTFCLTYDTFCHNLPHSYLPFLNFQPPIHLILFSHLLRACQLRPNNPFQMKFFFFHCKNALLNDTDLCLALKPNIFPWRPSSLYWGWHFTGWLVC